MPRTWGLFDRAEDTFGPMPWLLATTACSARRRVLHGLTRTRAGRVLATTSRSG